MGVFDSDGQYVAGTAIDRTRGETGAPVDPGIYGAPVDAATQSGIFAGVIYNHFGHFLVESLARAWAFSAYPEAPIVWAGERDPLAPNEGPPSYSKLRPWQEQILDALGITNPRMVVKYPTRFESLHVPDIGYRYADLIVPEHAEYLARYSGPRQVAGSRLYLSRSRTGSEVRDLSAFALERRLESAGWRVVFPEQLSVREQLDSISAAEVVAGEEGSAFHLLLLLDTVEGKRFQMFRRQGPEHPNMHTIGNARQVNQTFHSLTKEKVLSAKGREVTKLNPNAGEALDILHVPVTPLPVHTALAVEAVEVVNYCQRVGAQRILFVGWPDPQALRAMDASLRVAVSDAHTGDPRAYEAEGISIFDLDFDGYVKTFHDGETVFDLVVIHADEWGVMADTVGRTRPLVAEGASWLIVGTPDDTRRAALSIALTSPSIAVIDELTPGVVAMSARSEIPGSPDEVATMSPESLLRAFESLVACPRAVANDASVGDGPDLLEPTAAIARSEATGVKAANGGDRRWALRRRR